MTHIVVILCYVLCAVCWQGSHAAPGQLLLLNTTEAFNRLDKAAAIKQVMVEEPQGAVRGARVRAHEWVRLLCVR